MLPELLRALAEPLTRAGGAPFPADWRVAPGA
ncbi:hypothetical protein GA0115240_15335, partial [Streptomyces sp. DvalAA-14]